MSSARGLALAVAALLWVGCAAPEPAPRERGAGLEVHVLRLRPGTDLFAELEQWVQQRGAAAVVVLTACGSLEHTVLRLADQPQGTEFAGRRELVSLVGTLSATGGSHLHLAVSDATGATLGGHLLRGCRVYTTVELALGVLDGVEFAREVDPTYGYRELVARRRRAAN
ncbi:MAG: DUF296 domain-containing protein [Planctomycetes bacterium]|nr:DUF296 domain-containing protein [Planctomycetota bacterium]